jgi:probable F420-dependent oxidoreductase
VNLGLYGINLGPCAHPECAAAMARACEEAGYESLWTAEHVVLPDPQAPPSPVPPETEILDPAVSLAFVAAHTKRIRLATGIVILPQRNPVVLAKEFASLDRLSGGRLILGVAAGYLEAEFAAIGADFHTRGARTDEFIDAIRALWADEEPRFEGPTVRFSGIQSRPLPTQRPGPPIVIGGLSDAALRRAQRRGDGWYGFALDPDATAGVLERLRKAGVGVERDAPLEITITPPPGAFDPDAIARYAELGVDRLVPIGLGAGPEDVAASVARYAEAMQRAGL